MKMIKLQFTIIICCVSFLLPLKLEAQIVIKPMGVKINVTDMQKALSFYHDKLGFKVMSGNAQSKLVWVTTADESSKVALHLVNNLLPLDSFEARVSFTLQVNNLDSAVATLKSRGVDFGNNAKRKEGVGYAIFFNDPFGTSISLMHQTIVATPWFQEPKIYNYGFTVPDIDKARLFYKDLGFMERTEKFLPWDMPLYNRDKTFGFMLHMRERIEPIQYNSSDYEHVVVLFKTDDLDKAMKQFEGKVKFMQKKPLQNELGKYISFADAAGLISELIEVND